MLQALTLMPTLMPTLKPTLMLTLMLFHHLQVQFPGLSEQAVACVEDLLSLIEAIPVVSHTLHRVCSALTLIPTLMLNLMPILMPTLMLFHYLQVQFLGLSEQAVACVEDLLSLIEAGQLRRSTGSTAANADSSRSHAILQIALKSTKPQKPGKSRPPFGQLPGG
jgi:hypothetical protein